MARGIEKLIHIGIKGTVFGLDRATGAEVWQTPLKGSDFVNVVLDGEDLFAATKGEMFCLDPVNGQIRWNNPMRGFGWGLITIAATDASSMTAMAEYRRRQEASASAASTSAATAGG
jgi:outer membrane protein assembly factor BamB